MMKSKNNSVEAGRYPGLFLGLLLSLASCSNYLDVTPDNVGTIEYAFRNRNEAENYLFGCYAYLQRSSKMQFDLSFATSAEIIYPNNLTRENTAFDRTGFDLIRGTQNVGNPGLNAWDGQNGNYSYFRSIRVCNTMLENIDKPVDLGAAEKARWIAEVKFLKAYYHYELLRRYGPIPISDINLPIDVDPAAALVKRQPIDTVVHYIVALLDEAAPDLPPVIQNIARELGRITRPIALSVKAEVLAMAASPLYNGNPDYVGFTDNQGTHLFPQQYDPEKWRVAAEAAKAAIDACEAIGMRLYSFVPPGNVGALPDELNQMLTLQNSVTEKMELNTELIWALNPHFEYQGYCIPRMTPASVVNIFSNPSTFAVPIATQELFYSRNGVPMNEDKTVDFSGRYGLRQATSAEKYLIHEGYTTVQAHFEREPRFYASIAFDGAVWYGNGVTNLNNLLYVQARGVAGMAGPKDNNTINITGYWPKKLAHYLSVYDDGFQQTGYSLPKMRLPGLYLLYAETLNEYQGPSAEVYRYIDLVRQRAGLPGVVEAWTAHSRMPDKFREQSGLREIIRRERRIELCFEGQSGWDLRRWKEMQQVLSLPLQGWSVYEEQPLNYYRQQTVLTPAFGLKDYFIPIKDNNIVVNPDLTQNPYW